MARGRMSGSLSLVAADRLALARRRAERVARIERLWPALLPAGALFMLYLAASLFGLPQALPDGLHLLLLLGVAAAMVWLVRWRLRRLPPIDPRFAERLRDHRIERASALRHEPLATLTDRNVVTGGQGDALWTAHQNRIAADLAPSRAGWPELGLRRHDPWRLSLLLAIAVLGGLVVAGSRAPGRLLSGLWPGYVNREGPPPVVQAWIRSPSYSGVAPMFLATAADGVSGLTKVKVPAGAVLTATVTGTDHRPHLGGADTAHLGPESWTLTRVLSSSTTLRLSAGGYDLPRWHIDVVPRAAPTVTWAKPPTPAAGDAKTEAKNQPLLRLPWQVAHPYGVAALEAVITPEGAEAPVVVPIPLTGRPRDAKGVATPDLASNPLAGTDASVLLRAKDGAGETGESPVAQVRLPAHAFHNPLARAIQAQRKRLALHPNRAAAIAADLLTLGEAPGVLQRETDLYLQLAAAAALVGESAERTDQAIPMRAEAQARLWELALSLEDALGNDRASRAATMELRNAQNAVRDQMRRMRELGKEGQSAKERGELQSRIDALDQAIQKRMQALSDQAKRQGNAIPMDPQMGGNGLDLQKMMQQMQRDAAAGRTDQAMRELQQMQDMLARMRSATPRDAAAAAMQAQAAAQAREQMDGLKDITRQQTGLLDATQKRIPHPDPTRNPAGAWRSALQDALNGRDDDEAIDGPQPPAQTSPDRTSAEKTGANKTADPDAARVEETLRQHTLQRATDELAQEFKAFQGKLPDKLTDAGQAMQTARDALRRGDDAAAAMAQAEALRDLQDGGKQMHQTMADNSKNAAPGSGGIIPGFGPGGQGGEGDDSGGQGEGQAGAQDGEDGGGERDALGRKSGEGARHGDDDATSTVLPGADSGARSRALEQELRRRDSNRQRPPSELDYLDRLLRPFAQ